MSTNSVKLSTDGAQALFDRLCEHDRRISSAISQAKRAFHEITDAYQALGEAVAQRDSLAVQLAMLAPADFAPTVPDVFAALGKSAPVGEAPHYPEPPWLPRLDPVARAFARDLRRAGVALDIRNHPPGK